MHCLLFLHLDVICIIYFCVWHYVIYFLQGHTLLFALDGSPSELLFERLPEIDYDNSEWTEASSTDAICLIYQNLQKLDNLVCSQVSNFLFQQQQLVSHLLLLLMLPEL